MLQAAKMSQIYATVNIIGIFLKYWAKWEHFEESVSAEAGRGTELQKIFEEEIGNKSFTITGPRVWNSLPPELRQDIRYEHF